MVQRTPIIIERLPWAEVYEKFVSLIRYAASSVYNQFKTVESEDLFQEGQLILYRCWTLYGDRDWNQFTPMFKASLWRKLREISGKKRHYTIDLDTMAESGFEPGYDVDFDTNIDDEEKLTRLAESLRDNPIALTILKEFLRPSERTLWESKMEIARKEMLRSQNYNVLVPTEIGPTKKSIKRGMGISQLKFDQGWNDLKTAMKEVYKR